MIVMEETRMVDSVDIVLMEMSVDNVKVVWKDRTMGKEFEEVVVDLIYVFRCLDSQSMIENLNY